MPKSGAFFLVLTGTLVLATLYGAALPIASQEPPLATQAVDGTQEQGQYPHHAVIRLADHGGNLRLLELDSRVVEFIVVTPASPGGALLTGRLISLFDGRFERIEVPSLYDFILQATVSQTVLIPGPDLALRLQGSRDLATSGFLPEDGLTYPLGSRDLWGTALADPPRVVTMDVLAYVPDPDNPTEVSPEIIQGSGFLVEEPIRVGRLLPGVLGHNPEGTDECIKISTCELICNPPEQG